QARAKGALVAASRNGKQVRRGKRPGVAGAGEELLFTFARGHDILNEGLDIRADQVARTGNAGDDGAAREFPGHRREPTGQPEAAFKKECPQRKGSDEGASPVEHLAHKRLLQIVSAKVRARRCARPITETS